MAVTFAYFGLSLVLGWSALFVRGRNRSARAAGIVWLVTLIGLAALSPYPGIMAGGAAAGALTHLLLQLGLEERHA